MIVSSSLGVVLLVAVTFAARIPWPSLPTLAGTPWWAWAGGALGALYAVAAVLLARELGAATLMSLVVTGQLICSVVLDHFGWVGFTEHAAGMGRIVMVKSSTCSGVFAISIFTRPMSWDAVYSVPHCPTCLLTMRNVPLRVCCDQSE